MAIPLGSKKGPEVLQGLQEMYLRLTQAGYKIERIHTDRGSEFIHKKMKSWCLDRLIRQTTTVADDPASNGRAEAAVGMIKRKGRTILRAAGLSTKFWPYAVRYISEALWKEFHEESPMPYAFGARILIRNKQWQLLDAFEPRVIPGRYLSVGWELSRYAAYVLQEDGTPDGTVTRATTFWPDPDAVVPEATPGELLAAGWEIRHDPEGQPYYFHRPSGESTWERPDVVYEEGDSERVPGPRHRLREKTPPHLVPRQVSFGEAESLEEVYPPEDDEEPAKEDYWEETGRTWVRHHVQPRICRYYPLGTGGPVEEDLGSERATQFTYVDGSTSVDLDCWTIDTAEAEEPQRWTGKSIFMKAGPPGEEALLEYTQKWRNRSRKRLSQR
jgi:transposase InsO family protein